MKWISLETGPQWPDLSAHALAAAGLGILLVLILSVLAKRRPRKGRRARREPRRTNLVALPQREDMSRAEAQLGAIANVGFRRRRLLNRPEFRVFRVVEAHIAEIAPGFRVMAQTSLGELIAPSSGADSRPELRRARAAVNSKRLDVAVIDRAGFLALAVEYQGSGHHLGETAFFSGMR